MSLRPVADQRRFIFESRLYGVRLLVLASDIKRDSVLSASAGNALGTHCEGLTGRAREVVQGTGRRRSLGSVSALFRS